MQWQKSLKQVAEVLGGPLGRHCPLAWCLNMLLHPHSGTGRRGILTLKISTEINIETHAHELEVTGLCRGFYNVTS